METINFDWSRYKSWVTDTVKGNSQYYCRGQQDTGWKIKTSFNRYCSTIGGNLADYFNRIIPEVSYFVSAQQNEIIDTTNNVQLAGLLSKLQHHGFPTPLLDWTLSPYIAAYFAYKDINPRNNNNHNVAIYIFNSHNWFNLHPAPEYYSQFAYYMSDFRSHAKGNPRLLRQMAVTTITNVLDVEDYIIAEEKRLNQQFLWKLQLPAFERRIVMNELNLMGINSMTMFPDFDGMCSAMREKYFNNIDVVSLVPPPPSGK